MSGVSLINEMNELTNRLREGVKAMSNAGKQYAYKEREYKIALSQAALKRRDTGMPVTLIDKVIHGDVADKRFERDTAEVLYKASVENINAIKLQIRVLQGQIDKEWSNG